MKVDNIVIGLGAIGCATLHHLSLAGLEAIGIEQFDILHNNGSTHGETRAIRRAYFENPQYVPILNRAYDLWHELEEELGKQLFIKTGILEAGCSNNEILLHAEATAKKHNVDVKKLSNEELVERYPLINFRKNMIGLLEANAGYLRVDDCINGQLMQAQKFGAEIHTNEKCLSWRLTANNLVEVVTDKATYQCKKLIVCCGAWAKQILSLEEIDLSILIKGLYWHKLKNADSATHSSLPTFFFSLSEGDFYGFPQINGKLKFARHSGGIPTNRPIQERPFDHKESVELSRFISEHFPLVSPQPTESETCYYTCSKDNDFLIDFYKSINVIYLAGLSGHGFKMSNALGEIATSMAINECRMEQAMFLSASRFK